MLRLGLNGSQNSLDFSNFFGNHGLTEPNDVGTFLTSIYPQLRLILCNVLILI